MIDLEVAIVKTGKEIENMPDADECWFIVEGEWEWFIEGTGVKKVKANDIVVVPKKTPHQIKCVGTKPGIRLAITKADVDHVYV